MTLKTDAGAEPIPEFVTKAKKSGLKSLLPIECETCLVAVKELPEKKFNARGK